MNVTGDGLTLSAILSVLATIVARYAPKLLTAVGRMEKLLSDIRDDTRTTREAIAPAPGRARVRVHKVQG